MLVSTILRTCLFAMPATILLMTQAVPGEPASDDCKAKPGAITPRGGHWYYRINRTDKRRCWYVGAATAQPALRQQVQPASATGEPPIAAEPISFFPQSALSELQPQLAFTSRWPDDLPPPADGDNDDNSQAQIISSSYADASAVPVAPVALRWPVIEAASVQPSATDTALRLFSLAGMLSIASLMVVGWAAKFRSRGFSRHAMQPIL
jgi:hypothetical protein